MILNSPKGPKCQINIIFTDIYLYLVYHDTNK